VRRERILELVSSREFTRVSELRARFGISDVTVRADLDALARRGRVRRIRGGAMPCAPAAPERPFEETEAAHAEEKAAIGRAAAALVGDGETILLDVGTTTTAIARALVARHDLRDVLIVTSGLNIALELEPAIPRLSVAVTGGMLRPLQHSLVDPLGGLMLERLHAHTVFLGCNGVDPRAGVTNANLPEAELKRRMLRRARRRVVVADGSKIGAVHVAELCAVGDVDQLITGPSAPAEVVAALGEHELDVIVARPPGGRELQE
jgi:DeoR family transcriptional regulator of aga operon